MAVGACGTHGTLGNGDSAKDGICKIKDKIVNKVNTQFGLLYLSTYKEQAHINRQRDG